ncbi:MAG: helix-turn-helix transcriptional regulator [Candidatus Symbiothrix sp.]|jgi:transcriptional regulator with XRE-family HTH domain|nr:helix-turn-helix transcriptional regulator [Candidatus Symbiothrix sp.]
MKTIYPTTIHHGQNIKRLREMLGVKQDTIAVGLSMTQQAMSKLEQKEQIDDEILEKVSKILNIPADAIKNFNDESAINVIANTINAANVAPFCHQPIFNPIEKIVELYERMLKIEQEKNSLLEQIVASKKEK